MIHLCMYLCYSQFWFKVHLIITIIIIIIDIIAIIKMKM